MHPAGAVAARLYSLVLICKSLGINPEEYLTDVLQRVGTVPASEIASLTPWAWAESKGARIEAAAATDDA